VMAEGHLQAASDDHSKANLLLICLMTSFASIFSKDSRYGCCLPEIERLVNDCTNLISVNIASDHVFRATKKTKSSCRYDSRSDCLAIDYLVIIDCCKCQL